MVTTKPTLFERAEKKVDRSPRLRPLRDVILYDWPEGDKHWRWVILARVKEIESWAKTVASEL